MALNFRKSNRLGKYSGSNSKSGIPAKGVGVNKTATGRTSVRPHFKKQESPALKGNNEKEVIAMSIITIYATGAHKQKDKYGCYGVGLQTGKSKNVKEYVGQFDSQSVAETQLNILIYSIALALEKKNVAEIKVISDFTLIKNINDGTLKQWEKQDWLKENGNPISQAELWKELLNLIQNDAITFSLMKESDEKMTAIAKKVRAETRKAKNTEPLFEEITEEHTTVTESKQENVPESVPEEEILASEPVKVEEIKAEPPVMETVKKEEIPVALVEETKITSLSEDSTITIDANLKKECEKLFEEIGLPLDVAVTLLLKHTLREKGLDFNLKLGD